MNDISHNPNVSKSRRDDMLWTQRPEDMNPGELVRAEKALREDATFFPRLYDKIRSLMRLKHVKPKADAPSTPPNETFFEN
jgi:hypothetical protein